MNRPDPSLQALLRSPQAQRLRRHDRPGPRYTSYPTVPHWGEMDAAPWLEAVGALRGATAVYVHVPFCRDQCLYCGCNMVVAGRQDAGDRYLDALAAQLAALPRPSEHGARLARMHLGGGTPTWLSVSQLRRLFDLLFAWMPPAIDASISVEADPDVTTDAHLDTLVALGVSRVSFGVQSLDEAVCAGVGRPQRPEGIASRVAAARSRGLAVNLDLMYGLPGQTLHTWGRTLDGVCEMAPDRLAVFGYAHVPWMKPHQAKLDSDALPDAEARLALLLAAHQRLAADGWQRIGFDHFARPDDPLAVADRQGRLHRDFMGFTDRDRLPLVGLGPSAISELPGLYVQQETKLGPWLRHARQGRVPVQRGCRLTADDALRRDAILALTCQHRIDWAALSTRHGVDARAQLADADEALGHLAQDGLVTLDARGARIPEDARLLARRVAMAFDAYLDRGGRHSRVV